MKARNRKTYYAVSLVIGDAFMILAALKLSYWLKFESDLLSSPLGTPGFQIYAGIFGPTVILMLFLFRAFGLYIEDRINLIVAEISLVLRAVSVAIVIMMGISFFMRDVSFSRGYLVVAWFTIPLLVILDRLVLGYVYVLYRRRHRKLNEVLMIGANRTGARYAIEHRRSPRLCTRVVGILDDRYPELRSYRQVPVVGKLQDLESVLHAHTDINEAIVTCQGLPHEQIFKIMSLCEKNLVTFKWVPDILGLVATQMQINYHKGLALLSLRESPLSEWENRLIKRTMDVLLSSIAMVLLAPLMIFISLLVKLDSPGSAFYRQERIGEDGRHFWLYKFRTMRPDAEKETGPVWAKQNDDRRTRHGAFLRQSNLDELPQFWNVLKGDMSLVGPRPERPHFVGQFREDIPRYMGRHKIKSGITGWAQVHGLRGNTSIEERTKYDLFYIENWSIFLDLRILLMTFGSFKNAY